MSLLDLLPRRIVIVLGAAVALSSASSASAQDSSGTREASKHFQRAVVLYGEADYRAALVEFKRAYALSPNASVLYNVGEAEYQLQDYAAALVTFEHYLAEALPAEPHRAEIDSTLEVLRARVGHVTITTVPAGADVQVDEQSVGRTPLEKAVLVSIGHRKVTASVPGHAAVTRYVDVAADDNVNVTLQLPQSDSSSASSATSALPRTTDVGTSPHSGATARTIEWVSAGVLAASAATFGILALHESDTLKDARGSFPVSGATLSHDATLTTTYSIVADSLAAAALVFGGVALYSTLSSSSPSSTRGSTGGTRVMIGPGSARFEATF